MTVIYLFLFFTGLSCMVFVSLMFELQRQVVSHCCCFLLFHSVCLRSLMTVFHVLRLE